MNAKTKLENAVYNMLLDHSSLTKEEKKLLDTLPNYEPNLKKLEKIANAVNNLPQQPMPLLLKVELINKLMGPSFQIWQILFVLFFLLSTSATLLIIDNWNNLGQIMQVIIGCLITLILIPLTFFIYFQYEKQSIEIEKRIDYNLDHVTNYFKKWI